jgi:uncharacterized repeat protein (TIGR02543 family)
MLLLIVGSALSAQFNLLDDGFERPNTFELWDTNGITDWTTSPSIFHNGLRSARASNNSEGYLTSDSLDASSAVPTVVDFWFRKTATTGTGFTLYYYNGSSYNQIAELDGLGGDDTWLHYTQTITDTQYFVSDFRISFDATLDGGQFAYVDDVVIYKEYGETLTVSKTGSGSGTVTSNPPGISCGLDCSELFATDTVVTLSAVADSDSTFTGWSGSGCSGTGDCQVTMSEARSVTADFTQTEFTLTIDVTGNGSVSKVPDQVTYQYGDVVQLTATPATGWSFAYWSGDLTGSANPANITMDGDKIVGATFEPNVVTLTINQATGGTIAADPAGPYHYGDDVTLTATADPGYTFIGWTGDLTGTTNPATLHMDGDKTVSATFTQVNYYLYLPIIAR